MNLSLEIMGQSPGIAAVRSGIESLVSRLSGTSSPPSILIEGETGSGKGLLARVIHRMSPWRGGPFVDVNCAAIPPALVESEMFGFEQGAFTDARRAKEGLFQSARGGTIFLDELGLLPEGAQSKLLKVLEERMVRRLGSTRIEPVDVWVIAATNEDLRAAVRDRRFREDLYHRLAVLTLSLPPLRERGDDVLLLADQFLTRACREYGLPTKTFSPDARAALLAYAWPGNVRELGNVVERVTLLSDSAVVTAATLNLPVTAASDRPRARGIDRSTPASHVSPQPGPRRSEPGNGERQRLLDALEREGWNVSHAAVRLGITRNAIRYRIEKYGLSAGPSQYASALESDTPAATPMAGATPAAAPTSPTIRWERRRLAVLRVSLLERDASPSRLMSRTLELVVDKIQSFGGRVEQMAETSATGVFGLEPTEDAPRRAANAALAVHNALKRAQRGMPEISISVTTCLHVALAPVARIGRSVEIDATFMRETSRILDELGGGSGPDSLVVSAAAARFLERGFELHPLGAESGAYRLVAHERGAAAMADRGPRFVGRHRELEMLMDVFEAAEAGRGQLVGLTGEAGMGKSRLLAEFRRRLGDRSPTILEGRCLSYTTAVPYSPMLEVLRMVLDASEGETPETVRLKVTARLADLGVEDAKSASAITHLLGSSADTTAGWESPEALKTGVFEIMRRLFVGLSQQRPLLLIMEDMHWTDASSSEFLESLAEIIPGARIVLVETYRPGYRPSWLDRSYAMQIALQPLSALESRRLVEALVPQGWADASLTDLIISRGDGNPFFVEELARALQEHQDADTRSVPETVQDVLLARIDRLLPDDKLVLQSAAIIGRDVPSLLLQAVSTLPEAARLSSLARLREGEFIHETSAGREPAYTFRHVLIRDVAYDSVAEPQRCALHVQVVEAMERLYPTRLFENAERLADHAMRGALWAKAVTYFRRAGTKALAASSHRDAAHWFEQAITVLERLPQTEDIQSLAVDLRLDARSALLPLGEFDRMLELLQAAERLATALADRRRLGRVCAYLTDYFRQVGDHEQALEAGRRGLAAAEIEGDLGTLLATNIYLGHVYYDSGQYGRASAHLKRNVDSLEPDMTHERFGLPYLVSVHSRTWLAASLAELGQFAEAVEHAREALRIAEGANHASSLVSAHMGLGRTHVRRGDLERAIPVLERGVELARLWKMRLLLPFLTDSLGLAYAFAGRQADALPLLHEALDLHVAMRGTATQSARLVSLAQAHLLTGNATEAVSFASRALDLAGKHSERGYLAYAHSALGEAFAALPAPDHRRAERHWLEAAALCETLEMRPLAARCHLGLGTVYRLVGRADAGEFLVKAVALLREMAMPHWLAQAEAELRRCP